MSATDVRLALISHTNVGKTSLTRTLLRTDVGEIVDAAHTTLENTVYVLAETEDADRLLLWDTPGFGDSTRLQSRLEERDSPIGWFLGEVWDRVADRSSWSAQQAMIAARDHADVVLYQVNASEDPEFASYIDAELAILTWLGKPVILLLNQLPPQSRRAEREALERAWREHLKEGPVHNVLALDAFERCWVDEARLLASVSELLAPVQKAAMARLMPVWQQRSLDRFEASIDAIARFLADTALDQERLSSGQPPRLARVAALRRLAKRLDARLKDLDASLIRIEGLEGEGARRIDTALAATRSHGERPTPLQGAAGGAAMGAGAGAAIDLALGGAAFGLFTALGASLSAAAAWSWCQRAVDRSTLGWSAPFIEELVSEATARYLAVTHHGRARGRYRDDALDSWRELADEATKKAMSGIRPLLAAVDDPSSDAERTRVQAQRAARSAIADALLREYPHARWLLGDTARGAAGAG